MLIFPRPTTSKLLYGIRICSKALTNFSALYPLDGSSCWKGDSLDLCLTWVIKAIQSVTYDNLNLNSQIALQYGYHKSLLNLVSYANDPKLIALAMR